MKLLLVEDEIQLAEIMAKGLRKCNYAVDVANDGQAALYAYEMNEYDCIILDLNIPIIDGMDVLKQIRTNDSKTKILILSARNAVGDRVIGLDEGANDYLVKPFDFLELEARIRAITRTFSPLSKAVLTYHELTLDTQNKQVVYYNEDLTLTKKEYGLLEYLLVHQARIISSEELIEHIWESDVDLFSNSLKFHIYSMKKKMNEINNKVAYIQNLRGQGYQLKEVIK